MSVGRWPALVSTVAASTQWDHIGACATADTKWTSPAPPASTLTSARRRAPRVRILVATPRAASSASVQPVTRWVLMVAAVRTWMNVRPRRRVTAARRVASTPQAASSAAVRRGIAKSDLSAPVDIELLLSSMQLETFFNCFVLRRSDLRRSSWRSFDQNSKTFASFRILPLKYFAVATRPRRWFVDAATWLWIEFKFNN